VSRRGAQSKARNELLQLSDSFNACKPTLVGSKPVMLQRQLGASGNHESHLARKRASLRVALLRVLAG